MCTNWRVLPWPIWWPKIERCFVGSMLVATTSCRASSLTSFIGALLGMLLLRTQEYFLAIDESSTTSLKNLFYVVGSIYFFGIVYSMLVLPFQIINNYMIFMNYLAHNKKYPIIVVRRNTWDTTHMVSINHRNKIIWKQKLARMIFEISIPPHTITNTMSESRTWFDCPLSFA